MIYRRNERVLEMQNFTSGYMKGRTYGRVGGRTDGWADDYVTTKIYWMHRQPNFLTHGTPRNARESSAITNLLTHDNATKLAGCVAPKCSCRHFSRSNLTPPNSGSDFLAPVFLCIPHLFAWTFIPLTISQ